MRDVSRLFQVVHQERSQHDWGVEGGDGRFGENTGRGAGSGATL